MSKKNSKRELLANLSSYSVKKQIKIAKTSNDPKVLMALVEMEGRDFDVVDAIWCREFMPVEFTNKLMSHWDEYYTRFAAKNRNTSPEVLAEYAESEDSFTREIVASNRSTPWEERVRLAEDWRQPSEVRAAAYSNPSAGFQAVKPKS